MRHRRRCHPDASGRSHVPGVECKFDRNKARVAKTQMGGRAGRSCLVGREEPELSAFGDHVRHLRLRLPETLGDLRTAWQRRSADVGQHDCQYHRYGTFALSEEAGEFRHAVDQRYACRMFVPGGGGDAWDEIWIVCEHSRALQFWLYNIESVHRMGHPALDEIHHAGCWMVRIRAAVVWMSRCFDEAC